MSREDAHTSVIILRSAVGSIISGTFLTGGSVERHDAEQELDNLGLTGQNPSPF